MILLAVHLVSTCLPFSITMTSRRLKPRSLRSKSSQSVARKYRRRLLRLKHSITPKITIKNIYYVSKETYCKPSTSQRRSSSSLMLHVVSMATAEDMERWRSWRKSCLSLTFLLAYRIVSEPLYRVEICINYYNSKFFCRCIIINSPCVGVSLCSLSRDSHMMLQG